MAFPKFLTNINIHNVDLVQSTTSSHNNMDLDEFLIELSTVPELEQIVLEIGGARFASS